MNSIVQGGGPMSELDEHELLTEDDKKFIENVKTWFRDLRKSLFEILPADCILKKRNNLDKRMMGMFNTKMVQKKLLVRDDICLMCNIDICPWNSKVSYRFLRYIRIIILGLFYKTDLTKLLSKVSR